jgi:hypothetical protein
MSLGGIKSRFIAWEDVYDNGNIGEAATINWFNGNIQKATLTGDCTFTFSNPLNGLHVLTVAVGETTYDITWPESVIWAEGDDLGIDSNTIYVFEFYWDGTQYLGRACHYLI